MNVCSVPLVVARLASLSLALTSVMSHARTLHHWTHTHLSCARAARARARGQVSYAAHGVGEDTVLAMLDKCERASSCVMRCRAPRLRRSHATSHARALTTPRYWDPRRAYSVTSPMLRPHPRRCWSPHQGGLSTFLSSHTNFRSHAPTPLPTHTPARVHAARARRHALGGSQRVHTRPLARRVRRSARARARRAAADAEHSRAALARRVHRQGRRATQQQERRRQDRLPKAPPHRRDDAQPCAQPPARSSVRSKPREAFSISIGK